MDTNRPYLPEGYVPSSPLSSAQITQAFDAQTIVSARPNRCDTQHNLHFQLGAVTGIMSPNQVSAPWVSGAGRDIALLSRVGKETCFHVESLTTDDAGHTVAQLSRKSVQEQAMTHLLSTLAVGDVLPAVVTHLASFAAFVDIGCGIVALMPISCSGVSRIVHPKDRFTVGQNLKVVVTAFDKDTRRITVSHKELLGSWMENASYFSAGDTVQGVVRSVKPYGCFIELTPNLSGLTDVTDGIQVGDWVSVYIKSIRPEVMKIKLQIIQTIPTPPEGIPIRYAITDGHIENWQYAPPNYVGDTVKSQLI
ncbi:S1 RNA-binding domain-containing protein [Bengtsoniella intestinalis]|uniref:S1 RNA-binding domain-containing protein n=1 Tax=Bengtsoniella intestinalis TaxID=3073143 RepID=UPI00391F5CCD